MRDTHTRDENLRSAHMAATTGNGLALSPCRLLAWVPCMMRGPHATPSAFAAPSAEGNSMSSQSSEPSFR